MSKIVLATGNQGKVKELASLLAEHQIEIVPQSNFNVPDAAETGTTFIENAIIKARNAAQQTGLPALADDSGIEVDALLGRPGIYSARFAQMNNPDVYIADKNAANNIQLLQEMKHIPEAKRTARFRCCIVYMRHAEDPSPLIADGSWEGVIMSEPSGAGGFGYDPLFFVPTHGVSAAELEADEKNKISHRGKALQAMLGLMKGN